MVHGRSWIYALLTLTGGFLGGVLATQFAPGVASAARRTHAVSAEEFTLLDHQGKQRAIMKTTGGGAALDFYDQNGQRRVMIGEGPSGRNGVAIYSAGGKQIASLTVADDNQASLTLYDASSGRARAGLGVAKDGSPAIVLFDKNGKDRAEMHVNPSGKAGIALADETGKTVAGLPQRHESAQ